VVRVRGRLRTSGPRGRGVKEARGIALAEARVNASEKAERRPRAGQIPEDNRDTDSVRQGFLWISPEQEGRSEWISCHLAVGAAAFVSSAYSRGGKQLKKVGE